MKATKSGAQGAQTKSASKKGPLNSAAAQSDPAPANRARRDSTESSLPQQEVAFAENGTLVEGIQDRSSPPARKSTGPRTAAGKARSKYNATKHGILSTVVVLPNESQSEFDSLLGGLREHFKPEGTLENVLVEKLATLYWRYRRFLVAEGAEIQKATAFLEWDEQERKEKEAHQTTDPRLLDTPDFGTEVVGLIQRIDVPAVLEQCLIALKALKENIKRDGFNSVSDGRILTTVYGNWPHLRSTLVDLYDLWSERAELSDEQRKETPDECKRIFLARVDNQLEYLRSRQKEGASVTSEKMRLEALRQNVPDSQDRLLRHSASLERDFDRTLTQLERLQRMRLGQPVSSPIKVSFSS